ncbi:hypothetical protein [Natronospora cellulosivora (SeqCode)]
MSTVIGVFDNKESAEHALNQVRNAGITDDRISMVAKEDQVRNNNENEGGYAEQNLGDGAATGGAIGGIAGLIAGAGALAIPGIGPIIAAGPIAAGLTGLAAGGIAGGLIDMGIPEERGDYYEGEVKKGKIVAAVEADEDKVDDVSSVLRDNGASDVESH